MDFENKKIHGIHVSRYLASFFNEVMTAQRIHGGEIRVPYFYEWLEQLTVDDEKLTEEEIDFIYSWATCGKMEFEGNALRFIVQSYKET